MTFVAIKTYELDLQRVHVVRVSSSAPAWASCTTSLHRACDRCADVATSDRRYTMADKACIIEIVEFSNGMVANSWAMVVRARLGQMGLDVEAMAFAATADGGPGGWKPLLRSAVIAAALEQQGDVVDLVVFPDLTSL